MTNLFDLLRGFLHRRPGREFMVGPWRVDAIGAPFIPHLFTFTADGSVFTTNPTDVQVVSQNLNDSVGMGAWRRLAERDREVRYGGTFVQLNAFADTHLPGPELRVTFLITVRRREGSFVGPALVRVDGERVDDARLEGTRITIDEIDLADLNAAMKDNEDDEPAVDLEKILKDYKATKPPERKDGK